MAVRHALLASSAAIAVIAAPALAQTGTTASPVASAGGPQSAAAARDTGGLEEIVVTAERREVSNQKTPLNIAVIGGAALTSGGIGNSRDLLDSIPGLKMTVANPNNFIGLYGTGSAGGSQYSDAVMSFNYAGVPLARQTSASSSYYDLERVEVLKGPQGTLYGRNATVGAINVIVARPKLGDTSGSGTVSFGNYKALNTTAAVNLPLGDTVAARLAFQTTHHDGYFTNGLDDANNYGARGSVLFKPSSDLSILVLGDAYFNRAKGPYSTWRYYLSATQEYIDPKNPWFGLGAAGTCTSQILCPSFASTSVGGVNAVGNPAGFTNTGPNGFGAISVYGQDGHNNANQILLTTEINYSMPFATLTVQPAYVHTKIDFYTYSNGLRFANLSNVDQESLEARLTSKGGGRLNWVLGGFYFHENQDAFQDNLQSNGHALLVTPNLKDENYAVFADGTFSIVEGIRLLGGIRYTHETKSQDGYTTAPGLSAADAATIQGAGGSCVLGGTVTAPSTFQGIYLMPSNYCVVANSGNYRKSLVSWKVGAEADLARDSLLYGTVRTGFRAGGFTVGTGNTYRPEKLLAFEVGSKNRFFDRRLQLNVSGFYWKYKDQQVSQLQLYYLNGIAIGQTSYPSNFDGNLYGVESDVQALVTPDDRITADVLWAKGKYDSTPPVATVNTAVLTPQFNLPRNNLPRWTISGGYDHTFRLGSGASIVAAARSHYESRAVLRIIDPALLTPGDIRKRYAKLDLDVTYNAPESRWSIQAYVKNVTDKAVVGTGSSGQVALGTFFRPVTDPANHRSATLDPPRTYGVRISAKF